MKRNNCYKPELGQAVFGQPYHGCKVSNLLIAALEAIRTELNRVMWNKHQKDYDSPFGNTGNEFKCNVFEVEAYSWNDEVKQKYNFKWKNYEVSWYKYLGRGTSSNMWFRPIMVSDMLDECIEELQKYDIKLYE